METAIIKVSTVSKLNAINMGKAHFSGVWEASLCIGQTDTARSPCPDGGEVESRWSTLEKKEYENYKKQKFKWSPEEVGDRKND